MPEQKHIIGKVGLDLTLGKEEGHYAMQQRWAGIIKNKVAPALSDLFDQEVPPGEIWRVNILDIDLGNIHEKMSDREVASMIIDQVMDAFENYRTAANGHFEKLSVKVSELEALVYFLKNGYLPESALDLDVAEVFRKNTVSDFAGLVTVLGRQLNGSKIIAGRAARRLARQLPEKDLLQFLEKYFKESSIAGLDRLLLWYEEIATAQRQEAVRLKEHFWVVFFKTIFSENPDVRRLGKMLYRNMLLETKGDDKAPGKAKKAVPGDITENKATDSKAIFPKEKGKEKGKSENSEEESPETPKSVFCKNAGIVLLHPFLTGFFQAAGLLAENGGSFKTGKKRDEAIHWLYYLATGLDNPKEQDLAFMKFLCGQKIAVPIRQVKTLKKKYKAEAGTMLKAAIGHWTALKNTSPDGLREGFLQRQGRLSKKQHGYLLEMENKGQDILLGKLPWSMSVVHFPWMEGPLWVQWG